MLLAAVLKTLVEQDRLESYQGSWPTEYLGEESSFLEPSSVGDGWLQVGNEIWGAWSPDVVLALYTDLGAARLENAGTLDLWLLAVGGEVRRYWELQQSSLSRAIMASLVERGANPLRALQLGANNED
jgi:hypothetical protein